jgi:hypothetical protein
LIYTSFDKDQHSHDPLGRWLSLFNIHPYRLRVSGHYYPFELQEIVSKIKFREFIPIHITLNIEAKEAIRYYNEYFMLLGITEFTKVYLQINDNPMVFVNLFKLSQNARIGEGGVVELLKIANGHLPRVRLKYDRVKDELNSCRAELSNTVQIYQ